MEGRTALTTALTLLLLVSVALAQQADVVTTNLGSIRGLRKTANGKTVDVYYSIPFAKPPVGDLRFKRPEPAEPWTGVKSTIKKPNACLQTPEENFNRFRGVDEWNPNTPMSEDCLYLNVWVPRGSGSPRVTMVWIYGGGFYSGSSVLDQYDATSLVTKENVIVVTFNYRLGPLGYLYSGSLDAPGNQGMLDQVLAMQWVYDNVESFGGRKNSITLFGESVGSISIGFHLVSPLSQHLFRRGIMESGAPTDTTLMKDYEGIERTRDLASMFDCPRSPLEEAVKCLRTLPAQKVTDGQWELESGDAYLYMPIRPMVDGHFLPDKPSKLLKNGNVKDTEILIGSNKDEGSVMLVYDYSEYFPFNGSINLSDDDFSKLMKIFLYNQDDLATAAKYVYYDRLLPVDRPSYLETIIQVTGDIQYFCPEKKFVSQFLSRGGSRKVYMYKFEHRISSNTWPEWLGVMHAYEIQLVFALPGPWTYSAEDRRLSERMTGYWTRFAETGNPNPDGGNTVWPKMTLEEGHYLRLVTGPEDKVAQGLRREQCTFNDIIYPLVFERSPTSKCPTGGQGPSVLPALHLVVFCPTNMERQMSRPTAILVLMMAVSGTFAHDESEIVSTTLGPIQGWRVSVLGKDMDVYYGIPFAKPPVDDLRFKPPEPAESWSGVRKTDTKPDACFQAVDTSFDSHPGVTMWNPNTPMSEDCLYLNVWVPRESEAPKTTMVWIYGGGFYSGSSVLDVYDGSKLAASEDVIVVSINYRVGPLGFLYTGTPDAPGNQGLLDQVTALKWIYENVESFGGDQDSITIFGESAGAVSVGLHLMSPLSMDFFTRAIMQSGSPTMDVGLVTPSEAVARGRQLAEMFDCPLLGTRRMMRCLREASAEALSYAQWTLIQGGYYLDIPMTPIVDGYFLKKDPWTILDQEDVKDTELLIGVNKNEGSYFLVYGFPDFYPLDFNLTRREFKKLMYEVSFRDPIVTQALTHHYVDSVVPDLRDSPRDILDDVSGDDIIICPAMDFAYAFNSRGKRREDVYAYWFQHRLSTNPWPQWMGVMHGYEIELVFGLPLKHTYTDEEQDLSERMMGYWAQFAKTGDPNDPNDPNDVIWPKLTSNESQYLRLRAQGDSVGQGIRYQQCAFRSSILPMIKDCQGD